MPAGLREARGPRRLALTGRHAAPGCNPNVENSDHRNSAAADACPRAAIPATTATETARPMVPGGLDGERQLLLTGFGQSAGRYPQERLVSGRLAREWQLLHPLSVRRCEHRHFQAIGSDEQIFGAEQQVRDRGPSDKGVVGWDSRGNSLGTSTRR